MTAATPDPGSFRDPLSRIYLEGDHVYRALTGAALEDYEAVEKAAFFRKALADGRIIGTRRLEQAPEVADAQRYEGWLEHDRLTLLSYPYEWSFEMLKDAAILQMELLQAGLAEDVMCKDATSFNVQFVGSNPVFIDVGSFEAYRAGDPWFGFQQFRQLFLYPLMFQAYKEVPFHPFLRGDLNGIPTPVAAKVLSGIKRQWKGVWPYVTMPAVLESRMADTDRDVQADLKGAGFNKDLLKINIDKMAKLVPQIEWKASTSVWSNYSERGHYTDTDLTRKSEFVDKVAGQKHRHRVWDIGSNDGHFSRIAAEHADHVLALDGDHLVIDTLYKVLRREQNTKITPLVMDIASPSAGLGWRGRERLPFTERAKPDLVLALAVIHHIAITSLIPISEFIDFLADMGTDAVLEFPTPDDGMVKKLLRNKRAGVHDDYNVGELERHIDRRFSVLEREELPSGTRILYHLVPK